MESSQLLGVVRALSPAAVRDLCGALDLHPADRLELLHSALTCQATRDTLRVYLCLDAGQRTPPAAKAPAGPPELARGKRVEHRGDADSPHARRLF